MKDFNPSRVPPISLSAKSSVSAVDFRPLSFSILVWTGSGGHPVIQLDSSFYIFNLLLHFFWTQTFTGNHICSGKWYSAPPPGLNKIVESKQKIIFINISSLTKGICKKIALDSFVIWFSLCPSIPPATRPTHDLPSLILLLIFFAGGFYNWLCRVSYIPHIPYFIHLSQVEKK